MIFNRRNRIDNTNDNKLYFILLNIIFGAIVSLSTIILIIILLVVIPIIYKINALSIFYFKSATDDLLVMGIFISILVIILTFLYINNNIKKLSAELKNNKHMEVQNKTDVLMNPNAEIVKFLDEGEKRIYLLLIDSGGSLLQKDLVGLDGLSKATISRIIDRLEKKGIVEKIRHGSTNKIILKRVSR